MRAINYTSLKNEKKEVVIVINPIGVKSDSTIRLLAQNNKDLIIEKDGEKFKLNDFFPAHINVKNFLLVEYGIYGLVSERDLTLTAS